MIILIQATCYITNINAGYPFQAFFVRGQWSKTGENGTFLGLLASVAFSNQKTNTIKQLLKTGSYRKKSGIKVVERQQFSLKSV